MNKLQEDLRAALLKRNPWSDSFTVQNFSHQSGRGNELFFHKFSLINQLPSLGNPLNLCYVSNEKFSLNLYWTKLFLLSWASLYNRFIHAKWLINNVKITIPVSSYMHWPSLYAHMSTLTYTVWVQEITQSPPVIGDIRGPKLRGSSLVPYRVNPHKLGVDIWA